MLEEDILEREDILDLEGGLDFVVTKPVRQQFEVAVHKLAHKTPESVKKGVEMIKNLTAKYPELKNKVNGTLAEYVRQNPWKAASFPLVMSAIGALGMKTVDLVKDLYDRYVYADNKAYKLIQRGSRPGSTPFNDYWFFLQHYFVKGRAANTRAYIHPFKRMQRDAKINRVKKSGFNWKALPLTALAAISGAAAMRYFRQNRNIRLPPTPPQPIPRPNIPLNPMHGTRLSRDPLFQQLMNRFNN